MKYHEDFDKIVGHIRNDEDFAFSRFSDGEVTVLNNQKLVLGNNYFIQGDVYGNKVMHAPGGYMPEERKEFDPVKHKFHRDLLVQCIQHNQDRYYKGIPGTNEWGSMGWKSCIDLCGDPNDEHLTFANLFINGNYVRFLEEVVPLFSSRPVVMVANENARMHALPFRVVKTFSVGENCMINDFNLIKIMSDWVEEEEIEDHTFLFSAATLSNYLIYGLYKKFPNNQYMDIGSSLGPMMGLQGWKSNRTYLKAYWGGDINHSRLQQVDQWGS